MGWILPDKSLFKVDEAASILNTSTDTLYRWIQDGKITNAEIVYLPSGQIRIKRTTLERILS